MTTGPRASFKKTIGEPFARRGTFAAGWNDRIARLGREPNMPTDYNLGYSEACRLSADRGDAFNMIVQQ